MEPRSRDRTDPDAGPPKAGEAAPAEDGVDRTLIRWMLSLTPAERLQVLQRNAQAIQKVRDEQTDR